MPTRMDSEPANPKLNGHKRRDLDNFQDFPASGAAGGEEEEDDYGDYSNTMLKYINQMLMEEEDLEKRPCMLHDCIALQATEKYFSDVLHGSDHADPSSSTHNSNASSDPNNYGGSSDCLLSPPESQFGSVLVGSDGDFLAANLILPDSNAINLELGDRSPPKGKRNHYSNMEDDESAEKQRNKQLATSNNETEPPLEKLNEVLL